MSQQNAYKRILFYKLVFFIIKGKQPYIMLFLLNPFAKLKYSHFCYAFLMVNQHAMIPMNFI